MTNQEAINVMKKYTDAAMSKVVVEAHNMAIDALKAEKSSGWIPASKNPEEDGWYMVTFDGVLSDEDEPFTGMELFENGEWGEEGYILAWKPLPEPWKGKTNNKPPKDWKLEALKQAGAAGELKIALRPRLEEVLKNIAYIREKSIPAQDNLEWVVKQWKLTQLQEQEEWLRALLANHMRLTAPDASREAAASALMPAT